jgi:hypothetical protein
MHTRHCFVSVEDSAFRTPMNYTYMYYTYSFRKINLKLSTIFLKNANVLSIITIFVYVFLTFSFPLHPLSPSFYSSSPFPSLSHFFHFYSFFFKSFSICFVRFSSLFPYFIFLPFLLPSILLSEAARQKEKLNLKCKASTA